MVEGASKILEDVTDNERKILGNIFLDKNPPHPIAGLRVYLSAADKGRIKKPLILRSR